MRANSSELSRLDTPMTQYINESFGFNEAWPTSVIS
jgi:hypothetical protein